MMNTISSIGVSPYFLNIYIMYTTELAAKVAGIEIAGELKSNYPDHEIQVTVIKSKKQPAEPEDEPEPRPFYVPKVVILPKEYVDYNLIIWDGGVAEAE